MFDFLEIGSANLMWLDMAVDPLKCRGDENVHSLKVTKGTE